MKPSLICRQPAHRNKERGVTMALVAAAIVAIMAMAALSIDAVTLYLANAEAQRTADAAALAGAKVISVSGITGTTPATFQTTYWQAICGTTGVATQTAQAVAAQNTIGGAAPGTTTVSYSTGPGVSASDCSSLASPGAFAVNPLVVVKVQNTLPTFFARIWGKTGSSVSATAAAEGFNPSGSGTYVASGIVPVQPRCVKPWLVPNLDPLNTPNSIVSLTDGSITHAGISTGGSSANGVIGEKFTLIPDCFAGATCTLRTNPPIANRAGSPLPNLEYLPGEITQPSTAVPADGTAACTSAAASNYAQAIAGCDQTTKYQCGVVSANTVNLNENPRSGDTTNGVQCLIHQGSLGLATFSGQDTLDNANYPFQIKAGDNNPLGLSGNVITTSNSIVTVPIYDNTIGNIGSPTTDVTIVGFMQIFINAVDDIGRVGATVLNISGCSTSAANSPLSGSSPVPVRLITPP